MIPASYQPKGQEAFDFWFAKNGRAYYAFYLQSPVGTPDKSLALNIGMAHSTDLRDWTEHGQILRANPKGQWNDRCILTGSTWKCGEIWRLVYTALSHDRPQEIGVAESADLRDWKRVGSGPITLRYNPFVVPESRYWQANGFAAGRTLSYTVLADPYVLPEAIDGWYYMVANCILDGYPENRRGCLGLLRSKDGLTWEDVGIIAAPGDLDRLETPQVWRRGERWYLYFGAARENPVYRANFVYNAPALRGPFEPGPRSEFRLPDNHWFYIAKVLADPEGRDVLLACLGAALSHPYPVTYEADGSLTVSRPESVPICERRMKT